MSSLRTSLILVAITAALSGCGKSIESEAKTKADTAPALLLAAEDLSTLGLSNFASGPVISGSIQPERRADLRAEVSAVVLQVLRENGDTVRRGDLLVRLDDTAIRDSLTSADESARAAAQSFEQAERQFQRLKTLQAQGMSSIQAMEDAEIRRNNAQSDLVAAKARVAAARQQLQRTEVRAPFDGVVSERKVSAGDTAQVGKELVKVIDPNSMRFEGLVSADKLAELKLGQGVHFRVNGYGQTPFNGTIKRIDVAANATTRQVEVLVAFAGGSQPKAAGLYAEGNIETHSQQALMIEDAALVRAGDKAYVWRIKGGKLNKAELQLGERDSRTGDFAVLGGLAQGEQILRKPNSALKDGQAVELAKAAAAKPAASATATATGN
ncbi:efflux RND transporter periplasmic adaptor subunit [Paucibacter sp. APW11]|uniref:Efflux RND transporter periplasmic adaptor subunit n=1 Tax=Roseateles aquae TaxID=3077235 RepID=A0ABU3P5F4_9BURK|nr:efflux RND transporter periplasmic adaptor subunit [Paucibacter sp. APW11]MDT8997803.1 efflux RND transporter periplasmic adaptor subunit [Paucibacter sp. APW11]